MQSSSFIGFDFGTSNCACGVYQNQHPHLVSLPEHGRYMPSTLFAPTRDMMAGWFYQQLQQSGLGENYRVARQNQLPASLRALKEADLDGYDCRLLFGQEAFNAYLDDPFDCYYIKSPKSFLGASGLAERHQHQFEDIVAAMMWHMRRQVMEVTDNQAKKVVIGRPINFQGLNSEQSNQQAIAILTHAAQFAGFEQVEFLYEPLAAGLTYQASLKQSQRVLVVDIGGGTTDISLMEMGPDFVSKYDHRQLVLGYSGQRVGGNDFDIALNLQTLMPLLGMNYALTNGQPMPHKVYFDAAAVNDLPAQSHFYSRQTSQLLSDLKDDMQCAFYNRLSLLHKEQLTQRLNRSAEDCKITLASQNDYCCDLTYLEDELHAEVNATQMVEASAKIRQALIYLVDDVLTQANCQPDVLFLTGGSANSPVIRQFLAKQFPDIEQICADNFGSVTEGLTRWANQIYNG